MSLAEREDMYDKEVREVKKKVDKLLAHKTPQYKQGYDKAIDDFAEKLCNEVESFTATVDGIELDFLALDYLIEFVYEISKQLKS